MYYYKARIYSPTLGRFLQTDPIGYGDGLNWYNYVGGDPVNATDPNGLCAKNETEIDGECVSVTDVFARPEKEVSVKGAGSGGGGGFWSRGIVRKGAGNDPVDVTVTAQQNDDIVVTAKRHRYVLRFLNPCSASSVFRYFKQAGHSAPGAPAITREGLTRRIVLLGGNPISQFVNSSTGTIINTTLPGHRYFPGTVTIQVTPNLGGQTSTTVITGEGTGAHSEENVILGEAFFGGQAAGAQTACGI